MTGPLFQEYLRWFNLQMAGRKVLLLLDGFSAHRAGITLLETKEVELQNVRIEFLPANTTSVCQPLDQGIIRTFKAHYKRRWLQYQLDNYEAGEDPHTKMNVLQALRWCNRGLARWGHRDHSCQLLAEISRPRRPNDTTYKAASTADGMARSCKARRSFL